MKCENAEFVSALIDGEIIPRAAAEHIGECGACKTRLAEYAQMGAELRRIASLNLPEPASVRVWKQEKKTTFNWWQKGWQTMRIPRFAFALLMVAIVGLTSSLVVMRVRAQTQGAVLMLNVKTADKKTLPCPLLLHGQHSEPCGFVLTLRSGSLVSGYRALAINGSKIQLGVRTKFEPFVAGKMTNTTSSSDIDGLPETEYSFEPGETLKIEGDGSIPITITGQYTDHLPTIPGEDNLDPQPDVMRIVSPVLLRNKKEIFDFEGFIGADIEKGQGVNIYTPETGLYVLALSPMPGAVEGKLQQSRISFQMDGASYVFLMAVPVARADKVWILHEPDFRPTQATPGARDDQSFAGSISLSRLPQTATTHN